MNKNTLFLLALVVPLLTMGIGCSAKVSNIQPVPDVTGTDGSCVAEGQQPTNGTQCCVGLEVVAVDNAYEVCGKPGTGYKPKACMSEGGTPFVDTPKCCANLEPVLKGDKYICTGIGGSEKMKYVNKDYGFSLEFPDTWRGYIVKNRTLDWETLGRSDSFDFGFLDQDSLFNVSVHTKSQWQKIKSGEFPSPTYLGENNQYVFGYSLPQYSANELMTAKMTEVKNILRTFKAVLMPNTTITYYTLQRITDQFNFFCNGENMNSASYKEALTKKFTQTVVGNLATEEKIRTTLRFAAGAQSFDPMYTNIDSITFENGVVTMHSASGWAGASIFYCAWKPFVEKNLEQFAGIREIKWQAVQ